MSGLLRSATSPRVAPARIEGKLPEVSWQTMSGPLKVTMGFYLTIFGLYKIDEPMLMWCSLLKQKKQESSFFIQPYSTLGIRMRERYCVAHCQHDLRSSHNSTFFFSIIFGFRACLVFYSFFDKPIKIKPLKKE